MKKKDLKFKMQIQEIVSTQELNTNIRIVLDNAIQKLEDGRFNKKRAEEYIFEWLKKFKYEFEFTSAEKELYLHLKPETSRKIPITIINAIAGLFGGSR